MLESRDSAGVRSVVEPLHETELADLLETLKPAQRAALVELAGDAFDLTALTEVDEAIRLEIIDALSNEQIAEAVARPRFGRCRLHP